VAMKACGRCCPAGMRIGVNGNVPLPRVAVSRSRRARPTVRASGGGGLARGATTVATITSRVSNPHDYVDHVFKKP
jgi:hypothetical protein